MGKFNADGYRWDRRTAGFRQYVNGIGTVWGRVRSLDKARSINGYEAEVYFMRGGKVETIKTVMKVGTMGIFNKRMAEIRAMRFVRDHVNNDVRSTFY